MSSEMTRRFFLKTGSLVLAASAVTVPATLFNASPGRGAAAMPFKPHATSAWSNCCTAPGCAWVNCSGWT